MKKDLDLYCSQHCFIVPTCRNRDK